MAGGIAFDIKSCTVSFVTAGAAGVTAGAAGTVVFVVPVVPVGITIGGTPGTPIAPSWNPSLGTLCVI